MPASKKPRSERRADARRTEKDVKNRAKLAALLPGGAPANPIVVTTAALVEPKARALPCAICGESVRVTDHTARSIDGRALRLAHVACPRCGYERVLYFVIAEEALN